MKTYNYIKSAVLMGTVALTVSSCNDFLTVYPQDRVVEEQFWEDKNDLEGVRYAAYKNMAASLDKLILWGDLRSDAYVQNSIESDDQKSRQLYERIINGDIDTTMTVYDWGPVYTTINYCNKVLSHGEEVKDKDAQFTSAEWNQMRAEMTSLRALNYFYLVRAFKDIPYTTKVVNTDTEVEYFPQMKADTVLTMIIESLEDPLILGKCRNRFTTDSDTKGLFTNCAQYCLLSDIYLWRASMRQGRGRTEDAIADYSACIQYAEMSVEKLHEQVELKNASSMFTDKDKYIDFGYPYCEYMIKNTVKRAAQGSVRLSAHSAIFITGNSDESMLEIQFNASDNRKNEYVNSFYGNTSASHLVSSFNSESQEALSDLRNWFSAQKNITGNKDAVDFYELKWCDIDPTIEQPGTTSAKVKVDPSQSDYRNWIIYRLSDALMQKAEACACLANLGVNKTDNNTECMKILRMLARRWYVDLVNGKEPVLTLTSTQTYDVDQSPEKLTPASSDYLPTLMKQRLLEFHGEGKRFFDCVRYAERLSNADDDQEGMRTMYKDIFSGNENINITRWTTMRNHSVNLWGLYNPIYYMEMKAYNTYKTGLITQNPVWNVSKYDRR